MPDASDNHGPQRTEQSDSVGPVTAATERLVQTAEQLDAAAMVGPSRCPGWTRAHVLTHVARNADALTNLLTWASTGQETPMYPSVEARNADIEAGAARSPEELVLDLRESAARLSAAIADVPDGGWEYQVRTGPGATGATIPARRVVWVRLREVEIHHVDLDAGYSPADWPAPFVSRAVSETLRAVGRRDGVPAFTAVVDGTREPVGGGGEFAVHGSAPAMLAWLTGRSAGDDLQVEPAGRPPIIPPGAWL
jgi:maleylpyruvate isomerase